MFDFLFQNLGSMTVAGTTVGLKPVYPVALGALAVMAMARNFLWPMRWLLIPLALFKGISGVTAQTSTAAPVTLPPMNHNHYHNNKFDIQMHERADVKNPQGPCIVYGLAGSWFGNVVDYQPHLGYVHIEDAVSLQGFITSYDNASYWAGRSPTNLIPSNPNYARSLKICGNSASTPLMVIPVTHKGALDWLGKARANGFAMYIANA